MFHAQNEYIVNISLNFRFCSTHASLMFHSCFAHVSLMFHSCFTHVPPMFHSCPAHVSLMFHSCFTHVPPMFCLFRSYLVVSDKATIRTITPNCCHLLLWGTDKRRYSLGNRESPYSQCKTEKRGHGSAP